MTKNSTEQETPVKAETAKRECSTIDSNTNRPKKIRIEDPSSEEEDSDPQIEGVCCFCKGECNPASQSCGRCARNMTMNAMGW